MNYNNWVKFFASILICEMAGVVGSIFTMPKISSWYAGLNKPLFNPPNWIFGPVWTTIFVLMGISLFLVWKKKNIPLIFWVQIILNVLWSVVFFGNNSPAGGFFVLVMLWFAILFMMINFYRVSKATLWLLLPYILWVSFAGVLNFLIWTLN